MKPTSTTKKIVDLEQQGPKKPNLKISVLKKDKEIQETAKRISTKARPINDL